MRAGVGVRIMRQAGPSRVVVIGLINPRCKGVALCISLTWSPSGKGLGVELAVQKMYRRMSIVRHCMSP